MSYTTDTTVIHACYLACTDWASYEGKSVSEVSNERDAEFDRWLAEVKADAWDEGWLHNVDDRIWSSLHDNPYREVG